ncbi:TPA: 30S ribosomal protein S3 [bacterium]|nr:30S ribosomal protein S3 [bacterium]
MRELNNKHSIEISVQEVKNPLLDAMLVAKNIAEQIEDRIGFKIAMKKTAVDTMRAGAKGIKICCSGRLSGAEIAWSAWTSVRSIPLHTLRSDVDYALAKTQTTYGVIGIKVWICIGEYQHS